MTAFEEKRRDGHPVHFTVYSGVSRISIGVLKRNIKVISKCRAEWFASVVGLEVDVTIERGYDGGT